MKDKKNGCGREGNHMVEQKEVGMEAIQW